MPPEPLAAAVSACIACHLVPHDVGHYRRMHMKGWNYKRVRATAGHVLQHLHASASTWKESVDCEREGRVISYIDPFPSLEFPRLIYIYKHR